MASRKPANRALPTPPTGQSGQGQGLGPTSYPEPTGGPINYGLQATSHNKSNYPQPNSANQPDPASSAPPSAAVPGPQAYRPSLAGNTLSPSVVNPMDTPDEPRLPDYPS
jgi:hypothetical protein